MARTILVRHGEPLVESNVPPTFWRLSRGGEGATLELAARLGPLELAAVFASPEPKAVRTADLLAREYGVPVRIDRDLREHERASTRFLSQPEFDAGVERLLRSGRDLVFGDESADAVFKRMCRALDRARSADPDGDVVAVTHGTALSLYVGRMLGRDAAALWRQLGFSTAAILSGTELRLVAPGGDRSRIHGLEFR